MQVIEDRASITPRGWRVKHHVPSGPPMICHDECGGVGQRVGICDCFEQGVSCRSRVVDG